MNASLIAVIADTHDKLPEAMLADLSRANEIWHLGDVKDPAILGRLREIGVPVFVVRGNRDTGAAGEEWPMEVTLTRGGRTFRLIHMPPAPGKLGEVDFLLHGHTHVPRDEVVAAVRVLNPGTVGKPNQGVRPGYAWLEVSAEGEVEWRLVALG
jgi:hypothetical protein